MPALHLTLLSLIGPRRQRTWKDINWHPLPGDLKVYVYGWVRRLCNAKPYLEI